MKDTSRPRPAPSSRSVPYRKRKVSVNGSPIRGMRRPYDASQPPPADHVREAVSASNRPYSSRWDEPRPMRLVLNVPADDERRGLSKGVENRVISHTRRHTSTGGSTRQLPSPTNALGIHVDVPGPPLRLPLTSVPPLTGQEKAESPPPSSVTAFLRSIELPDKPPGGPLIQKSLSHSNPPLRLPSLSTDTSNKAACTNGAGYQVSLVYNGYPFTYDLSALPDDPKGTIALLDITKSDPGAYILVGAHYRRTGRSRAACAVIRSLLDNLDSPSDVDKGKEDAAPAPASATSTVTLVSPGSPCSKTIDSTRPVFQSVAMRPAMLLLAACELDISREHPDDPESTSHATTAHDLFRAVYGIVNDAIVAGAVRPEPKNVFGLDFSSKKNCLSSSLSDSNGHPLKGAPPPEAASLARVKDLEKELSTAHAAQKKLQDRLTASNDRLARAEDEVHVLESHSREMLVQLNATRDENWELRQRLVESEQRERELVQCTPTPENRVWGRIKDLFLDNLGGGMRGV